MNDASVLYDIPIERCDPILRAIGEGFHEELAKIYTQSKTCTHLELMVTHAFETSDNIFCLTSIIFGDEKTLVTYGIESIKVWYILYGETVFGKLPYNSPHILENLIKLINACASEQRKDTFSRFERNLSLSDPI